MYILKTEKPRWAKKSSCDFYYRDRGRVSCEGFEDATTFSTYKDAEVIAKKYGYEIEEF